MRRLAIGEGAKRRSHLLGREGAPEAVALLGGGGAGCCVLVEPPPHLLPPSRRRQLPFGRAGQGGCVAPERLCNLGVLGDEAVGDGVDHRRHAP